jgi:hypothetical protein
MIRTGEVAAWLRANGVAAKPATPIHAGDDAYSPRAHAEATRAEPVVAGAYGSSWLCEWALGG